MGILSHDFPKLKWPLNRTGLKEEQGLFLLAYDMVWRWHKMASISHLNEIDGLSLLEDTRVNLNQLGLYIVSNIGADRFENYENIGDKIIAE